MQVPVYGNEVPMEDQLERCRLMQRTSQAVRIGRSGVHTLTVPEAQTGVSATSLNRESMTHRTPELTGGCPDVAVTSRDSSRNVAGPTTHRPQEEGNRGRQKPARPVALRHASASTFRFVGLPSTRFRVRNPRVPHRLRGRRRSRIPRDAPAGSRASSSRRRARIAQRPRGSGRGGRPVAEEARGRGASSGSAGARRRDRRSPGSARDLAPASTWARPRVS